MPGSANTGLTGGSPSRVIASMMATLAWSKIGSESRTEPAASFGRIAAAGAAANIPAAAKAHSGILAASSASGCGAGLHSETPAITTHTAATASTTTG